MVSLYFKKNEHGGIEIYSMKPLIKKPVADVWKDDGIDNSGLQKYLVTIFLNSHQMSRALSRIYTSLQKNRDEDFLQDFIIQNLDIFDEEISPEFLEHLKSQAEFMKKNEVFKK